MVNVKERENLGSSIFGLKRNRNRKSLGLKIENRNSGTILKNSSTIEVSMNTNIDTSTHDSADSGTTPWLIQIF